MCFFDINIFVLFFIKIYFLDSPEKFHYAGYCIVFFKKAHFFSCKFKQHYPPFFKRGNGGIKIVPSAKIS